MPIYYVLQLPPHRQSLKDRWGLEEGKPRISDRQEDTPEDLHRPNEFPREDAGIRGVLVDQCQGGHKKTDKVGLHKGPLDLPVLDLAGPMDDHSLGQDQCTGWSEDRPGHQEFPIIFRQKDKAHRGREKETDGSDNDGEHRMDHEQCVEALAGGEVIFEFSHGGWMAMLKYYLLWVEYYDY